MDPVIEIKNIKVIYNEGKENEFVAANDISLEVYPGEYSIFFGPSGCGKSTLLYTILGLQTPSAGKVFINKKDTSDFSPAEKSELVSQFFGIIFQNYNLIYSLNVSENVALPQVFINVTKEERTKKSIELLRRFGIESRAQNLAGNLSGGQQQRVAICRALINDPGILLADEPVGNLDSESADVVMETLKEINKKDKKTIILVTHDPRFLPYADRVYYFKDSKLVRVVRNEGVTGGKETTTEHVVLNEFEKVAQEYSHMTPRQLKAWTLSEYLTQELSLIQRERMEIGIEKLLAGELSQHAFFEFLDKPYSEGGVGLYKPTAVKYALKIGDVIKKVQKLKDIKFKDDEQKKAKVISLLEECFLDCGCIPTDKEHAKKIKDIVAERVFGKLTMKELEGKLNLAFSKGGGGLKFSTANCLSERLETILTQLL